jgi:thiol-disulfide isomerase/thioredoxin
MNLYSCIRFLFFVLLSFFAFIVRSQSKLNKKEVKKGYYILGRLNNAAGAKIYLEEIQNYDVISIDSATADNTGKFFFKGNVQQPTLYILRLKNKRGISTFILENAGIKIYGDANSLGNIKVTGSKENDIQKIADNLPENKQMAAVYDRISEAFMKTDTAAINNVYQGLQQFVPTLVLSVKNFISSYPGAYASVGLLNYFIDIDSYFPDLGMINEADKFLKGFKTVGVSNRIQLNFLDKLIQTRLATSIGKMAPEIVQPDVTGKLFSLSSLKGKYVLIDFWASWCGPCRKANVGLVRDFEKYREKNFTILSVSLDDSMEDWTKAIKKDGMAWINVSDLKAANNMSKLTYGIKAIPANLLIDPIGKIIAKGLWGNELQKILEHLML